MRPRVRLTGQRTYLRVKGPLPAKQETIDRLKRFIAGLFRHGSEARRLDDFTTMCDHMVDQAVVLRLLRRHVAIAIHIALDLLDLTARMLRIQTIELVA